MEEKNNVKQKKEKNNKTKIMVISLIILLIIVVIAVAGYFLYRFKQELTLMNEASTIGQMDILEQTIDMDIKTSGKYAKVEETMKQYMKETSEKMKQLNNIYLDESIPQLIGIDNIKQDGPEFTVTLTKLEETKKQVNELLAQITPLLEEQTIMERIKQVPELNQYYNGLYYKMIFGDGKTIDEFKIAKDQLTQANTKYLELIDLMKELLTFLKEHKTNWEIEQNQIMFDKQSVLDKYQEIIERITSLEE